MKISQAHTGNKLNRIKLKDLKTDDTIYIVNFYREQIQQGTLEDIKQSGTSFRFQIKCKDGFNSIEVNDPDCCVYYFGGYSSTKALVSDIDLLYEKVTKTKTFKLI